MSVLRLDVFQIVDRGSVGFEHRTATVVTHMGDISEMSTIHRIESLKSKHAQVDKRLSAESARPLPDESTVLALKKQKLQIKDEIQSLATH